MVAGASAVGARGVQEVEVGVEEEVERREAYRLELRNPTNLHVARSCLHGAVFLSHGGRDP